MRSRTCASELPQDYKSDTLPLDYRATRVVAVVVVVVNCPSCMLSISYSNIVFEKVKTECKCIGCIHINTSTSPALYGFLYTSSGKQEFACISTAAVHIHTSMAYLQISLVRVVSVQVVFLSNSYKVNYSQIALI